MTSTEQTGAGAPTAPDPAPAAGSGVFDSGVVAKLSTLDRYLAVWSLAAMAVG
ncbi:arsenical-resistance protein, partial [Streptomyces lasiicapitis]